MKFFEIFLILYMALMMVVTARWIHQVKKGVISVFNQHLVLLILSILILLIHIIPFSPSPIERVGYIVLSLIGIIYFLDLVTGSSEASHEDARIWMGWTLFFLGVTGLAGLVMNALNTQETSKTKLIGVAIAVFTPAYRWIMTRNKDQGLDSM